MSNQRSREIYSNRSETTERKRKISTNKTRSAVSTRSMTAIAGTTGTGNGPTMDANVSASNTKDITDFEAMDNISLIRNLENIKIMLEQQNEKLKIISQENSYVSDLVT